MNFSIAPFAGKDTLGQSPQPTAEPRAWLTTLSPVPVMKRLALSPGPTLGVLAFVLACMDATSPNPHAALRPEAPTPAIQGNLPPPPTRTGIDVTVSSTSTFSFAASVATSCTFATGAFEGAYFSNGKNVESDVAATQLDDPTLAFEGTAWLRIDNAQPDVLGTSASANARFQRTDQKLSGKGSLVFSNGCVVVIDQVTSFIANPACNAPGEPCAQITFTGTSGDNPVQGTVTAFDLEFCEPIDPGEGPPFFSCSDEVPIP